MGRKRTRENKGWRIKGELGKPYTSCEVRKSDGLSGSSGKSQEEDQEGQGRLFSFP
jgi:hypothetical protein